MELAEQVGARLRELRLTLAVADAASAGRLPDAITAVPGSSAYFLGALVPYDNASKVRLLRVRPETLARHGAVSAQAAEEMAAGVRDLFGADVGLATTGLLGPSGGSAEKPVGLVWAAVASERGVRSLRHQVGGDRQANKEAFALAALGLLAEELERWRSAAS